MLISELKPLLKERSKDDLEKTVIALYKAMPKRLREEKQVDLLIEGAGLLPAGAKEKPNVAFADLQDQVNAFLENAYQQNYMAPNQVIHKKDRPKWRFIAAAMIKDLSAVPADSDDGRTATDLLVKLYQMLCHACHYYLFRSDDPFRSVGIVQTRFLDLIASRILLGGISPERVRLILALAVDDRHDRETVFADCMNTVLAYLKTPDSRQMAIGQGQILLAEQLKKRVYYEKHDYYNRVSRYSFEQIVKNTVTIVCTLYLLLDQVDDAVRFFKDNTTELFSKPDPVSKYRDLLGLLEKHVIRDAWLREYALAMQQGIAMIPRNEALFQHLKKYGAFPDADHPLDFDDLKSRIVYVLR